MLWTTIKQFAQTNPNEIAIVGEAIQYSWQQLESRIYQVAQQLSYFKAKVVALYQDNSPEWIIIDLACSLAQVVLLPLPAFFSQQQVEHALKQAGAVAIIYGDESILSQIAHIRVDKTTVDVAALKLVELTACPVQLPEDTTKITFTSGSTGHPKGVCLSNQQQLNVADALLDAIDLGKTKHLSILPFSTLLENIGGVYAPLISGGTVIAISQKSLGFNGDSGFDLSKLTATITTYQPQSMILLPELLQALLVAIKQGWQPPESLRFIALGGSKVSSSLLHLAHDLGLPVFEGYGLSECGSVVSLNTPDKTTLGSIGKVLKHISVSIEQNEIVVSGNTFLGYIEDSKSWYQQKVYTGDLGFVDQQGFLHINGRKKNLIISSFGRNINPEWLESELLASGLLKHAVIFGDAKPYCIALVQPRNDVSDKVIQNEIDTINQRLPTYAQLKKWIRISLTADSALITANGRPIRSNIYQQYQTIIENLYKGD